MRSKRGHGQQDSMILVGKYIDFGLYSEGDRKLLVF